MTFENCQSKTPPEETMKVLIATDGSECAEVAAKLLARLPHADPLELTIVSVNQRRELVGAVEYAEWVDRNFWLQQTRLEKACQRIEQMFEGANVSIESVVVEGHAAQAIVHEAKARNVDLVVIGAVGHATLDRVLLGSVSDFVATHVHCSVLTVRPNILAKPEPSIGICLAYDDSKPCQQAIAELGSFRWGQNTRFDVVSVMSIPISYSDIPIEIDLQATQEQMMQVLEKGIEPLRKLSSQIHPQVIESSHVGDAIVQFAKKMNSDIIVMGSSGRGLIGRFFLGSVSRYVLRHASCSVWIARS
jgi:nucleotide-binding universal stress UspA family protein